MRLCHNSMEWIGRHFVYPNSVEYYNLSIIQTKIWERDQDRQWASVRSVGVCCLIENKEEFGEMCGEDEIPIFLENNKDILGWINTRILLHERSDFDSR